jgi:integrase
VIRNDLGTLGDLSLERIRPGDVQAWTDAQVARGLAPATVRRSFGVIRSALEEATRLELLGRNPAARITLPKLRRREFPDVDLAAAVAAATTIGDRTLVRLAAATGARRGQIVGLRWSDVDPAAEVVTFRRAIVKRDGGWQAKELKSGNVVRVSVDPGTLAVLAECAQDLRDRAALAAVPLDPDPFYLSRDLAGAEPWYPDTATSRWRAIAQAAGLDGVRLHDLRHAHASELIAAGVDVATVSSRLGHASPAVTLRIYAHPVSAADRAASAIAGRVLGDDLKELAE